MKTLYVICDTPRIYHTARHNVHIRTINHNNKPMVIASNNAAIMKHMKDTRDDFYITEVTEDLLREYCSDNNMGVFLVSRCFCSLKTKKPVCMTTELQLDHVVEAGVVVEDPVDDPVDDAVEDPFLFK